MIVSVCHEITMKTAMPVAFKVTMEKEEFLVTPGNLDAGFSGSHCGG